MLNTIEVTDRAPSEDLMIWLANLDDLRSVYGNEFAEAAMRSCLDRLAALGIAAHQIAQAGTTIMVADVVPAADDDLQGIGEQRWAEIIQAALGCEPVSHGSVQAYLQVEVEALGGISMNGAYEMQGKYGFAGRRRPSPAVGRKMPARWSRGYQEDMRMASRVLDDLRQGHLALALQPVSTITSDGAGSVIYHECLLRRTVQSLYDSYTVPEAIEALERLELTSRLDRSVLWAVMASLQSHGEHSLGCNMSARSFAPDAWWDGLFTHLENRPDIAQRLVLEITETSTFACEKSAFALIRHLQILGVRVALDDIGPQRGSLDILSKVHANIIKLDKSVLDRAADGKRSARMLQGLVRLCADRGASVVVEGIETADDWEAARCAGAHGAQGFFIARPSLHLPQLLEQVLRVNDILQPVPLPMLALQPVQVVQPAGNAQAAQAAQVADSDWGDLSLSWTAAMRPAPAPYQRVQAR